MTERSRKPRRWLRALAWALAAVVLVAVMSAWQSRGATRGPAPPLAGISLDGEYLSLENHRGQPVLVYFWASWCPVCGVQQGAIDAIARDHAVLSVSLDDAPQEHLRAFLQERGVSYPVIQDPHGMLARAYGVRGVPAAFIVDGEGRIRFVEVGYTTELGLRARLRLAGR